MKEIIRILVVLAVALVGALTISKLFNSSSKVENSTSTTSNEIDESKYEYSSETVITLADNATKVSGSNVKIDGNVIYITNAGAYRMTGSLSDGRIIVDAKGKDVKIILDNCNITCTYGSPIYVYKSSSTMIDLEDQTTNTLTDGSTYTYADEYSSEADEEPNACLYSKSDLVICGSGTLNVNANNHNAITSKDTLLIENATINVKAKGHGMNGKDNNTIRNATINIASGEDAIRSTNEDDETLYGWIVIEGSDITINAGDDGIHAESYITIDDSNINIVKSHEGIEGKSITINSGEIMVNADDDGINVNGGKNNAGMFRNPNEEVVETGYKLMINGGTVTVNCAGDGLDSNGSMEINGGYIIVNGPTNSGNGAIDYDGSFIQTGGTLIAVGASGMAQGPSKVENQGVIFTNIQSQSANAKVVIKDENDNTIIEFTSQKAFSNIVVSSPDIKADSSYKIYINDTLVTTVTATTQSSGINGGQGGGRGMMNFNGQGDEQGFGGKGMKKGNRENFMQMEDGKRPELPEGMKIPEGERPEMPTEMQERKQKTI